jgi:thiol-disulfide isomerase/thioredoxin
VISLLLAACDQTGGPAPEPAPARFQSVAVDPKNVDPPEAFCDVWLDEAHAKPFPEVKLDEGGWTPPATWRWVNVWATWCGPCVAEMPRLQKWEQKLAEEGTPVELLFLSVDKNRPLVERFRDQHPGTAPSLRIADESLLPEWIGALGLDAGTAIPIHAFVDPKGRLRCLRTGGLGDHHLASVRNLVRQP